ncbi:hypothetical protein J7E97_34980 [Streptomyces sp. ISL-66]|nr:hypothetical protein [Streptomyces sp. ISL-66]MBT2472917.1 hypothetical protein [Streptomyces sp. ISL-66]
MPSSCEPQYAPAGDVGAALMVIDSRLKSIYDDTETGPEQRLLTDQFIASLGPRGAHELLDGTCTLIYMFMTWLRKACEEHDEDVIQFVVPNLVATMSTMSRSVPPQAIPTMAGMVIAAGTGLSPSLWRKQYGEWTEEEMTPLEATAILLAEQINRIADDREFATRLITAALSRADDED